MLALAVLSAAGAVSEVYASHSTFDEVVPGEKYTEGSASFFASSGGRLPFEEAKLPKKDITQTCLPASCACVDGELNPQDNTQCCQDGRFECGCQCDLTAGMCDPNCCCDSECSDEEKKLFSDSCIPQTSSALSIPVCVSGNTFESITTQQYGLQSTSAQEGFLCIEEIKNPSLGVFFKPPGKLTPSLLERTGIEPEHAFGMVGDGSPSAPEDNNRKNYAVGDRLQVAFASKILSAFGGYMPLPSVGPNGRCADTNYMRYRVPVTSNTCPRRGSCLGSFSSAAYVEDIRIKRKYSKERGIQDTGDAAEWAPVTVSSLRHRDVDTGVVTSIDVPTNGSIPATVYDGANKVCANALLGVRYTVFYDATDATITSVSAQVLIGNVSAASATTELTMDQEYGVEYMWSDAAYPFEEPELKETALVNNLQNRSRSGNPGYILGKPVLAGTVHEYDVVDGTETKKKKIIDAYADGLRMPLVADENGRCVASSPTTQRHGRLINFGHDALSGCTISVTRAQLKALCTSVPSDLAESTLATVPGYFNLTTGIRVGAFGNANPFNDDEAEWPVMSVDTPSTQGDYDDKTGKCTGMVTSADFEFLTHDVGSFASPQAKIGVARVMYRTKTINFHAVTGLDSETNDIVLTSTATFVKLKPSGLEEYIPPAPPFFPSIPHDVFYPFEFSPASRTATPYGYFLATAVAVVALVLFV